MYLFEILLQTDVYCKHSKVDNTIQCLCGKEHISRVMVKARKGLVAVKTMAVARMTQKILVILFQSLLLSVIEYMVSDC